MIRGLYISDWEKFINSEIQGKIGTLTDDTFAIISSILICTILNAFFNDSTKEFFWVFFACEAALILFSWRSTYKIGSIILKDINPKNKSEFFWSTSNLTAVILVISYITSGNFNKSFDGVVKTVLPILALLLPTIKMYNFIISEYYEYEKEHSEVNETEVINKKTNGENKEKIQYNDAEQFINSFESIDDLSNLEKTINEKRRKLEKEQFDNFKRFVNKFATFEDLYNLEKIIVEIETN